MYLVMGFNINHGDVFWYVYTALTAGEGLLIFMGMIQDTFTQHPSLAIHNSPGVCVMVPARVAMAQGSANLPGCPLPGEFGSHHFDTIGHHGWLLCQCGNKQKLSYFHSLCIGRNYNAADMLFC